MFCMQSQLVRLTAISEINNQVSLFEMSPNCNLLRVLHQALGMLNEVLFHL